MDLVPVKAWQCIGCGRIEAPQSCVGICQDRKVEFVYAVEHERAMEQMRKRVVELEQLARQLAYVTPREGEWARTYSALQRQARRALSAGMESAAERASAGGRAPM